MDIAEVRAEEGKLRLFVAINRTSKFVYAELHRWSASPKPHSSSVSRSQTYKLHTILPVTASSSATTDITAIRPLANPEKR